MEWWMPQYNLNSYVYSLSEVSNCRVLNCVYRIVVYRMVMYPGPNGVHYKRFRWIAFQVIFQQFSLINVFLSTN